MSIETNRVGFAKLGVTVFVSGAAVMVFELLGSRVVAPYLGSSIFTWTSLIGVILFALSVGYSVGGRLADKRPEGNVLGLILMAAGMLVGLATFFKDGILEFWRGIHMLSQLKSFFAALTIFALPSFFLGMVSPFAARLAVKDVGSSGSAYGNISSLSTAGSIVGTFLAGYWLISEFGTTACCYGLAMVLLVLAAWWARKRWAVAGVALVVVLLWGASTAVAQHLAQRGWRDMDTAYGRIWVMDRNNPQQPDASKQRMRYFMTDPYGMFSAMYRDAPDELAVNYFKGFDWVRQNVPAKRVLMAGGAGYVYPTYLLRHTDLEIDSVEIDPQMWPIAKEYFGASESPRHRVFAEDIRTFLAQPQQQPYDLVFYDVFVGTSIPFHTTTLESWRMLKASLAKDGVVVINLIDGTDANSGRFSAALCRTLGELFAQVTLYAFDSPQVEEGAPTNQLLIASDADLSERLPEKIEAVTGQYCRLDLPLEGAIVLRDDYAPVENLLGNRY